MVFWIILGVVYYIISSLLFLYLLEKEIEVLVKLLKILANGDNE